jgi:hypothetical protein
VEVGDLSSREIEPDRAIADLFSHHGGRKQSRKSGTQAAIGQAQRLATAFSKISFEPSDFLPMFGYPKFHNEIKVPIVRIGCREFKCIGAKPPQDHPHLPQYGRCQ